MKYLWNVMLLYATSVVACGDINDNCASKVYLPVNISNGLQVGQVQKVEPIKGIFSFGMGKNFPYSPSLQLDYISGMSSIFTWESLEPLEGHYDFTDIDKEIEWAAKNKKLLNICLYAGNKSPAWLALKKIPMIQWKNTLREDQAKIMKAPERMENAPAFWNITYLNYWKKFVTALAGRYKNNPTVGYVSITGPTPKDLSTGTVIRDKDDWKKVVEAGYTHQQHVTAWRDIIDHFVKEFPNKPLVLALGPLRPGGSSSLDLSEGLVDYILDRKYRNIHFLCVILNDTWFQTSPMSIRLRNLFKRTRDNGHTFGYQMIYSAQRMGRFESAKNQVVQDFGESLQVAMNDGVSWIEIWHDDIIDPKHKTERIPVPNVKYDAQIRKASSGVD